ncbi:MAG: hypothetical protein ABI366_00155, partial [Ginsengibacter sp.]
HSFNPSIQIKRINMKSLFIAIFLLSFLSLKAQQKTDGDNDIKAEKTDSIFSGKIIIDKTKRTKLYLTTFQQTLDSTGVYTTTYTFGAKTSRPSFDVNIRMKFDGSIIPNGPIGFLYSPVGVGRYSGSGALQNNNSYLYLQGQMTSATHHFYIKIKSNEKVQAAIAGLDGQAIF